MSSIRTKVLALTLFAGANMVRAAPPPKPPAQAPARQAPPSKQATQPHMQQLPLKTSPAMHVQSPPKNALPQAKQAQKAGTAARQAPTPEAAKAKSNLVFDTPMKTAPPVKADTQPKPSMAGHPVTEFKPQVKTKTPLDGPSVAPPAPVLATQH